MIKLKGLIRENALFDCGPFTLMSLISGPGFSYPTLAESMIQVRCDFGRRKIRWLQKIEAGWITNIPRYADPFDKYSPVWITNMPRYADLFDKYSQVLSDSTGFCGVNFHGRKIHKVD